MRPLPENYVQTALASARTRPLEDNSWFAEIPGFDGVWANASSPEACLTELREVLDEWILLKLEDGDPLPSMDGHPIVPKEAVAV